MQFSFYERINLMCVENDTNIQEGVSKYLKIRIKLKF